MSKESSLATDANISEEIRRGLVNSLFADSRSLLPGLSATAACAFVGANLDHSWTAWAIGVATIIVVFVRLQLVHLHDASVRQGREIEIRR